LSQKIDLMQTLLPHPDADAPQAWRCRAQAHWSGPAQLVLHYELEGELATLRLPAVAAQPARRDGLWQHSCFELFLRSPGQAAYLEANFSPAGHWAAWVFGDYRSNAQAIALSRPHIEVPQREPRRFLLQAMVDCDAALLARLAPGAGNASALPWQLGLSAVLEDQAGTLSHWALAHPRRQPDFHDAGGHTLLLAPWHDRARSHA
jgi:hypothetical protein